MWVRLKTIQYVAVQGRQVTKYPGEWVNVGKQQALSWIATGGADRPDMPDLKALPGCGIVLLGDAKLPPGVESIRADGPRLEFAKTLIWSGVNFRGDLLATGFCLLDTWELAVPLLSYQTLARDVGDEAEREETRVLIHDLRVPVYDTRLLFVRRCDATRRLMQQWLVEQTGGGDDRLALLRAVYRVKPIICALPTTWVLP